MHRTIAVCSSVLALVAVACNGGGSSYGGSASTTSPTVAATEQPAPRITSSAFEDGGSIPVANSCAGAGTSPALQWSGAPAATKAFALIVDDPDAPLPGGYVHWLVYDLPPSVTSLDAGVPAGSDVAGGKQGASGGGTRYTPACPPKGASPHHYHFRLYALDAPLGLAAGATRDDIVFAMKGHVLAQGELIGLFGQ